MASNRSRNPPAGSTTTPDDGSFFEQQRDALVGEIAQNLELVLQNINKLNRSLEGVIAVGNEFGSVEALWSQFEGVMARDPDAEDLGGEDAEGEEVEGDIDRVAAGAGEQSASRRSGRAT